MLPDKIVQSAPAAAQARMVRAFVYKHRTQQLSVIRVVRHETGAFSAWDHETVRAASRRSIHRAVSCEYKVDVLPVGL